MKSRYLIVSVSGAASSKFIAVPRSCHHFCFVKELEAKILELIGQEKARRKITGVEFVYVGSLGSEPNWFARPLPSRVSEACMREFVSALAQVRRGYDRFQTTGATALFNEPKIDPISAPITLNPFLRLHDRDDGGSWAVYTGP
jgi:hypothetical protein